MVGFFINLSYSMMLVGILLLSPLAAIMAIALCISSFSVYSLFTLALFLVFLYSCSFQSELSFSSLLMSSFLLLLLMDHSTDCTILFMAVPKKGRVRPFFCTLVPKKDRVRPNFGTLVPKKGRVGFLDP